MPRFIYKGRDKFGKEVKGIIDGANESTVALELLRGGTTPISIKVYVEKTSAPSKLLTLFQLDAPTLEDIAFLCRQMHSLIKAGVPLMRATQVVMESVKNYKLRSALADVLAVLKGGQSLSLAMRHHPQIFPPLMIALVNVGENTGSLDEVFRQIATHFEKEILTKRQIAAAVRYPLTVLIVISIAIVVVNIFVIPAFTKFFTQFKTQLPLPTRILIASSNFFVVYWHVLLGGIIGMVFLFRFYLNTPRGRQTWDKWKLQIPIVGDIIHRALLARFTRSFALSMRTGVPLLESINMISKTTDNAYVAEQIINISNYVERGESLTSSASKTEMFTPLVLQMLSIGEETGEIDKLLDEAASYYEQEVDYDVKRLGDAIEPLLIVVIAGFVLLLALGIFLPMWDLWKTALGKS